MTALDRVRGSLLMVAICVPSILSPAAARAEEKGMQIKIKKSARATTVDFAAEFGLGFDSLTGLGARIEQARRTGDPVGLAVAGKELSVAEKVSNKQAAFKSSDLLKDAVDMARVRNRHTELRAVALLIADEATRAELEKQAVKAESDLASQDANIRTRGVTRYVRVHNRTSYDFNIVINFNQVGTARAGGTLNYYVGDRADETTVVSGWAPGTTGEFQQIIQKPFSDFDIYLNP